MSVHEEVYKNHRIRVEYDNYCENPFEEWDWPEGLAIVHTSRNTISILDGELSADEFSTMVEDTETHFIEQYGEDVRIQPQEDDTWLFCTDDSEIFRSSTMLTEEEAWEEACKEFDIPCEADYYWLPVYKYDHSGVAYNTTGFTSRWDSGQVGYIYINKTDAAKEWKTGEDAYKFMRSAIKILSDFASGNCWGYVVEKEVSCSCGEHSEWVEVDSCWEFIGDMNYCLDEAKAYVDAVTSEGAAV